MKKLVSIASAMMFCAVSVSAQQSAGTQSEAQDNSAMEQRIKDLEERIISLEGQVRMLKSTQAPPAAAPTTPSAPEAAAQTPAPSAPAEAQQGQPAASGAVTQTQV